jgi:uncharacterized membrane protein
MPTSRTPRDQFVIALGLSTVVSVALFAYGALRNHSLAYDYLVWNLFLSWLPLVFAFRLTRLLRTKLWSAWEPVLFSLLWLVFLPNSFYMVSDFIHLKDVASVDLLYDAVMFTSFIYTAVLLGFSSMYIVHLELKKRFRPKTAATLMALTILMCSIGIYIGRDLRWNSWDVVSNPAGLLFDLSDRFLHPSDYPQMFVTVGSFFALLGSMYALAWNGAKAIRRIPNR